MPTASVLTGDLIASTAAGKGSTDRAMAVIEAVADNEAAVNGADTRFARYRGDGWQIYCSDPSRAFRLTALILANLKRRPNLPQTRLSVATGEVAFLPETGLASASGPVFSMSGQTLDGMTTQRLEANLEEVGSPWKLPLFLYLDWQASRWTPEQAEAVAIAFRYLPPRPRDVAETLGISRQAAASRLQGAGYWPLEDAARSFADVPVP